MASRVCPGVAGRVCPGVASSVCLGVADGVCRGVLGVARGILVAALGVSRCVWLITSPSCPAAPAVPWSTSPVFSAGRGVAAAALVVQ